MHDKTSTRMADLDFVAISAFLQFVEVGAELVTLSTFAIFSFKVTPAGIETLLTKKIATLETLVENNKKLCIWVADLSEPPSGQELVILRSLYLTTKESINIVRGHVAQAEGLIRMRQDIVKLEEHFGKGADDDLPF